RRLADGALLAVKGIGGYHLACDAANGIAVAELRTRKRREDRPFALMVRDAAAADELVELGEVERTLLVSGARPIVLAPRRPGAPVAGAVAPGVSELGVMLPYAPLHHVLLADLAAFVGAALPLSWARSGGVRRRGARPHRRQRLGGADRLPRRRCAGTARTRGRRLPRARPPAPDAPRRPRP